MSRFRAVIAMVLAAGMAAVVLTGVPSAPATAVTPETAVLDWNMHAYNALGNPPTAGVPGAGLPPQAAIVHLAMVQGAVYDAVNSIVGGHEPYVAGLPSAPPSASQAAAVATGAHDVLVGLVLVPPLAPAIVDRLDGLHAASVAAMHDGPEKPAGLAAGAAAAAAMLATPTNDGRFVPFSFPVASAPGQWRPTPPSNGNDPFAWVARVNPFVLESASQFRSAGPQPLTGPAY